MSKTVKSPTINVDWEVYAGNHLTMKLIWSDKLTNIPYDLSDYSACFEIRDEKGGDTLLLTLTNAISIVTNDTINSGVTLNSGGIEGIPNIEIDITPYLNKITGEGDYFYALKLTPLNGKSITKMVGEYKIIAATAKC